MLPPFVVEGLLWAKAAEHNPTAANTKAHANRDDVNRVFMTFLPPAENRLNGSLLFESRLGGRNGRDQRQPKKSRSDGQPRLAQISSHR